MPQRDAARASSATTGRSAVPETGPGGGGTHPVGMPDTVVSVVPAGAPAPPSRPSSTRGGSGSTSLTRAPADARSDVRTGDAHPVDQRAAARAGLAAGRSPSLWWVCTGIVAVLVITLAVDVTAGASVLAGLLAVSALARAVLRPGPVALSVRSRTADCAVLTVLAVGVGLLAHVAPIG